jgi:hypothetical protein
MRTLVSWLKMPAFWIPLLTFAVLAFHPLPACIDCEVDHFWGSRDIASPRDYDLFVVWFLSVSFAAGAFWFRKMWLLPLGLTLADLGTQHLGGVAWWSLRENEGPVILFAGLFFGYAALAIGVVVHLLFLEPQGRRSKEEARRP